MMMIPLRGKFGAKLLKINLSKISKSSIKRLLKRIHQKQLNLLYKIAMIESQSIFKR
ncbi:Hypothetical predicted protein [Olea europaea subsp. europaea]|uniref:Uncharacterized protein n=1 Tax=Olea europaea subsp. europaea TaxID=158383 RepID=A0A8S0VCS7_OLEEU|nr:Hypothetical predicted protein [Olea europaea subsp. europaea]